MAANQSLGMRTARPTAVLGNAIVIRTVLTVSCHWASGVALRAHNVRPTPDASYRIIPRQNAPLGRHCACGPTTGPAAPLARHCPDGSDPLTGRQPELEYYQTPRSDARRTSCSRGAAALHLQACPKIPRRGHAGGITEKGVQNRRFWCVFGYFCHKTKVTAGPGCASPGHRAETVPPAAGGGSSRKEYKNSPFTKPDFSCKIK